MRRGSQDREYARRTFRLGYHPSLQGAVTPPAKFNIESARHPGSQTRYPHHTRGKQSLKPRVLLEPGKPGRFGTIVLRSLHYNTVAPFVSIGWQTVAIFSMI